MPRFRERMCEECKLLSREDRPKKIADCPACFRVFRDAQNATHKEWRERNPDKILARDRRYRTKQKVKIKNRNYARLHRQHLYESTLMYIELCDLISKG